MNRRRFQNSAASRLVRLLLVFLVAGCWGGTATADPPGQDGAGTSFVVPLNGVRMDWKGDPAAPDGGYWRSAEPFQPEVHDQEAYCRLLTFNCRNRGFFSDHYGFAMEDGHLVAKAGLARPLVVRSSGQPSPAQQPMAQQPPVEENVPAPTGLPLAADPEDAPTDSDRREMPVATAHPEPDVSRAAEIPDGAVPQVPAPRVEILQVPAPSPRSQSPDPGYAGKQSGLVDPSELPEGFHAGFGKAGSLPSIARERPGEGLARSTVETGGGAEAVPPPSPVNRAASQPPGRRAAAGGRVESLRPGRAPEHAASAGERPEPDARTGNKPGFLGKLGEGVGQGVKAAGNAAKNTVGRVFESEEKKLERLKDEKLEKAERVQARKEVEKAFGR